MIQQLIWYGSVGLTSIMKNEIDIICFLAVSYICTKVAKRFYISSEVTRRSLAFTTSMCDYIFIFLIVGI